MFLSPSSLKLLPNPKRNPLNTVMKGRSLSSSTLYIPPHQRPRSIIDSSNSTLSPSLDLDWRENRQGSFKNPNSNPCHEEKNNYDVHVEFDNQVESFSSSSLKGASNLNDSDEWKWKLTMLIRTTSEQEVVSREKKDRQNFEQIAAMATKMGLHSQQYARVIVISKVPLPDYRFDLDDKRPQREVIIEVGLQRRVEALVREYDSENPARVGASADFHFSRSSSSGSTGTDEGISYQREPQNNFVTEKILHRRSLQMHAHQLAWERRGRAGRVQPGECFCLYPRCVYDAFSDTKLPEILRTPLQSLCLQIKSLQLGSISEFLSRAMQSPEVLSVQNAIEYLKIIEALDGNENLTCLGSYLSVLPMEPKLGKMLILGAIFNCLDPILTVVAGLSVRDPFLMPMDKKDLAEYAKSRFAGQDFSDHLALIRAYDGWRDAERDQSGHDYCWKNFLSTQTLKAIDSLRKQFFSLLKDTCLVGDYPATYSAWSHDEHLIRALICAGLYPGVCSVMNKEKSVSLKTMEDGRVLLSSNSVNGRESHIPYPWIVFNDKVKVNSVFLRDSTAISDSILLLFGGSICRGEFDGHLKMMGGYLEFFLKPDLAEIYLTLKRELEELIQSKLVNPKVDMNTHKELLSAIRLLVSEDRCDGRFIFGRQILRPGKMTEAASLPVPCIISRDGSGPGGDNSKSKLQTLVTRAGHQAPMYRTIQVCNNQFQATVEFNEMQFTGKPCNNKKVAEKDAAAEALQWLTGGIEAGPQDIDRMSLLLKQRRKK